MDKWDEVTMWWYIDFVIRAVMRCLTDLINHPVAFTGDEGWEYGLFWLWEVHTTLWVYEWKLYIPLCAYFSNRILCMMVPDLTSLSWRVWFNRVEDSGIVGMVGSSARQKVRKFPVIPESINRQKKWKKKKIPWNYMHHIIVYTHYMTEHTFHCHLMKGFWSRLGKHWGSRQGFHSIGKSQTCISAVSLSGRDVDL